MKKYLALMLAVCSISVFANELPQDSSENNSHIDSSNLSQDNDKDSEIPELGHIGGKITLKN